jgi:hypothetical protein
MALGMVARDCCVRAERDDFLGSEWIRLLMEDCNALYEACRFGVEVVFIPPPPPPLFVKEGRGRARVRFGVADINAAWSRYLSNILWPPTPTPEEIAGTS